MAAPSAGSHDEPFGDKIYLLSTVLDPQFCLQWVDIDVVTDTDLDAQRKTREGLKEMLQGMNLMYTKKVTLHVPLFNTAAMLYQNVKTLHVF